MLVAKIGLLFVDNGDDSRLRLAGSVSDELAFTWLAVICNAPTDGGC